MGKHLATVARNVSRTGATVAITDSEKGEVLIDIYQRVEIVFTANDGAKLRMVLRAPDVGDPLGYERMSDGFVQRFAILRLHGLWINDKPMPDVKAIGYSELLKRLILLQEATNIVGGMILRSRPVSVIKYRPFGARPTIVTVAGVSVV